MIFIMNPNFCANSKKFMLTKTNVKIKNLIYSLVCVLYRMEKRSVRTFDKYINKAIITFHNKNRSIFDIFIEW